jgi:Kdo2-lipid IVA lauroyltransferase/acyltransferase
MISEWFDSGIIRLVFALGKLPIGLRRLLGSILGRLVFVIPSKDKKVTELQLARFFPAVDQVHVSKQVFANLGITLLESFGLPTLVSSLPVELFLDGNSISPSELLDQFSPNGRSHLALTAHTGNWDFLAAYFSSLGYPIAAIGRRANRSSWQKVLERVRSDAGVRTLWRDDSSSGRKIIEAFKGSCFVAALIDQDIDAPGISVDFLGEPTRYATGLVSLAIKLKVPCLTVFGARLDSGGFRFYIERITLSEVGSEEGVLFLYGQRLERFLRDHPDQWVWNHKRWRSLPNGTRRSSSDYLKWLESQRK